VSGIAVLFQRDGAPADAAIVRRMLGRLAHRGPDGERVVALGPVCLGHRHFWTTPEEVGEEQPLTDPSGRYEIVLDGVVDNRDEVGAWLGLVARELAATSDAALLSMVFARRGAEGFSRVVGSFAAAIWDVLDRRLTLVRDPLGDRTLSYALVPGAVVVASEEQAVLAHPAVDHALDERRLAQYFAVAEPDSDATFFAAVREVLPGHAVVVDMGRCTSVRTWEGPSREPLRLRGDAEYGEAFRAVLAEAVRARMRSTGPVSVLLSGGLDSSSIAATAASLRVGPPVKAVSWVFEELPSCDEREWIDPVVERCGLEPLQFPGDGEWPLREFTEWRSNPNSPEEGLYRRLMDRAYVTARAAGSRVVLSGAFGDQLYGGTGGWFWERLAGGRPLAALADLWRVATERGSGRLRGAVRPRRVPAWIRRLRRRLKAAPSGAGWLTPRAHALLGEAGPWPASAATGARPAQHGVVLGLLGARDVSIETFHTGRIGVEVRYPFRDRRLVEFVLRLPSDQLDRPGLTRPVLREAMRELLPEVVRTRVGKTSLVELLRRGVAGREAAVARRYLTAGQFAWERFVRADWVAARSPGACEKEFDELVLWLCMCLVKWREGCQAEFDFDILQPRRTT
jgi:asparagine synthase (glutamine-hydrolysing)